MKSSRLAPLFVALFASGLVQADAMDSWIQEAMKKNNVPGAVVLVTRDGKAVKSAA